MVLQEEPEMPLERPSRKNFDAKVTRHELLKTENLENELPRDSKRKSKKHKRKHRSNNKDVVPKKSKCDDNSADISEINKSDIEELRSVYKKCKEIVTKIESKYSHLLDLNSAGPSDELASSESEEKCTCAINKKIVFEDDGTMVTRQPEVISHICAKKSNVMQSTTENTLEIEYEGPDTLPDDLPSLTELLKNLDLETTIRNKIISKIRVIKDEHLDEYYFQRHAVIEKTKSDPDEVLDFKGTNFPSLPGYALL